MTAKSKVGVIGVAIIPCVQDERRSLEELLFDITRSALSSAGLTIEDIDGIVVAGNDQYDGRAISVMAASGSVGGVDRDILSTPSAGEHAFVMGALRVASGLYRTQLVVAWSPTEAGSIPEAQRLANDPYFHRRLPQDELATHALQAGAMMSKMAGLDAIAAQIAVANRGHGAIAYPALAQAPAADPGRWPLAPGMVAPFVTGAVALVLASPEYVAESGVEVAWISGMGWATEAGFLGDRDLAAAPALVSAAAQAYGEAAVAAPAGAFEVAEVADGTPFQQMLALETLGLAPSTDLPVNRSGGALSFNPVFCTGLIRIAEIAAQVLGRAGPHQVPGVRTGLAHAASGPAMQYQTVVILRRGEQGVSA